MYSVKTFLQDDPAVERLAMDAFIKPTVVEYPAIPPWTATGVLFAIKALHSGISY